MNATDDKPRKRGRKRPKLGRLAEAAEAWARGRGLEGPDLAELGEFLGAAWAIGLEDAIKALRKYGTAGL